MTSTISVETTGTHRNALPLADAVEREVKNFLDKMRGELDNYVLSGTVLDVGLFGKTLVTINWRPGRGSK
jgi:hypothetical protein